MYNITIASTFRLKFVPFKKNICTVQKNITD